MLLHVAERAKGIPVSHSCSLMLPASTGAWAFRVRASEQVHVCVRGRQNACLPNVDCARDTPCTSGAFKAAFSLYA